jgi:hypothetical protein
MTDPHSRATTAGTRDAWFQAGELTVGNGRIKMIASAIRANEHPYCSFDRYNNLVGSRHVELRPGC